MSRKKKMLKVGTLLFCMFLVYGSGYAQLRTIIDGGNWSAGASWSGGNIANSTGEDVDTQNSTFKGTETMTVDGNYTAGNVTFFDQTLTIDNNNTLALGSQALFDGGTDKNFTAQNNVTININAGATFVIYGDLIVNNNLTLNVVGTLIVKGDLVFNNGGDLTVDGSVTVDGTIAAGNNSTLSGAGTVSAGDCTGDPDVCGDSQLPIELVSFDALVVDNAVKLSWVTATEENNSYFTVERSKNGIEYSTIATIDGAGNSSEMLTYNFVDESPLFGRSYYRLSQTDFDGQSESFDARSIYISNIKGARVFPNPVKQGEELTVYTGADSDEEVTLNIYNNVGIVVFSRKFSEANGTFKLSETLLPGLYVAKVKSGNTEVVKRLLIK